MMNFQAKLVAAFAVLCAVALLFTFEYPPIETVQSGYRGTGMAHVVNVRANEKAYAALKTPDVLERSKPSGTKASEVFKNVKVLGDVDQDDFIRLMSAITEWVSPDQGCAFCHKEGEDLSADTLYPKVVARRMLEMTRHINGSWAAHVGETGVTCYTCHRGKPVPPMLWSKGAEETRTIGMLGYTAGQNMPAKAVGLTSLPADPFSAFLNYAEQIRVVSPTALPEGNPRNIKETEATYGLMMHMSQALGVNCTFCHNSRAFSAWDQSSPKRVTSWHGIRMVRSLNMTYIEPLKDTLPVERLGAAGDVPKVNCSSCHQGVFKPLYGRSQLSDFRPELTAAAQGPAPAAPAAKQAPASPAPAKK
jgi:photosynthetic reaction center cytochrome c subunit